MEVIYRRVISLTDHLIVVMRGRNFFLENENVERHF